MLKIANETLYIELKVYQCNHRQIAVAVHWNQMEYLLNFERIWINHLLQRNIPLCFDRYHFYEYINDCDTSIDLEYRLSQINIEYLNKRCMYTAHEYECNWSKKKGEDGQKEICVLLRCK